MSAVGGVTVEVEQVEQGLLGVGGVGEDVSGAGAAAVALVEQDGLLDPGEVVEQAAHGEVVAGVVGGAAQ